MLLRNYWQPCGWRTGDVSELTAAERSTVEAVVGGVQRRARRRRQAGRSGWALLATAGLSLPIIGAALDNSITLTTAVVRILIALTITTFVATMVGSLVDNYQSQAALQSVEKAVLAAREAAKHAVASADSPDAKPEALTNEPDHDH